MDFGVVVGLDGLGASSSVPETTNKHKWYGSEFLNQDWRTSKLPKTAHDNYNSTCKANNANLLRSDTTTLFSSDAHQHQHQHQMLSYSSPKLQGHNATFSAYNRNSSTASVQTGRADVSVSGGGMHGILSGVRGPFTPSQWMELEHQALIYKYISANVPIPYNLLIPIRKALDSAGFSTFTAALLRPNTFGWGSFHYGFSSNTDLEPGRCRRTDGKKWRCSRDAVAEQKYCERHINRGRHRSRKPVEGQTKHLNNNNRMYMNKEEVVERIQDLPSPTIDAKSKENPFLVLKQQNPFDHSSRTEFGHVSSDSLLNPSNKTSTLTNCLARDCDPSAISWPELSISIPTTSCPNNDNVTLSSLRLSREFDPIQTSLIPLNNEPSNRQANWIPISWGTSMGGPLGEVLHNSTMECKNLSELNFIGAGWDNSPRLGVGSSPTGVLQKMAFGSLSSSRAGSSPRAENNRTTHQGTSLCNDLFDTIRSVNPSAALPAL